MTTTPDYHSLPLALADYLQKSWQHYQDICQQESIQQPIHSDFLPSLVKVWGASEFVVRGCLHDPALLTELFATGDLLREYHKNEMHERLQLALLGIGSEVDLMSRLRQFRTREMIRIAWRSLAGWANLSFTSQDLTGLADACIYGALELLSSWLIKEMGQPVDRFGNAAQMLVVVLGKLGARDLNFSSDVDLMFVYPMDDEFSHSGKTFQQYFIRLGQQLMKVLSVFTADGFVFRVDMRLRPYGTSGSLATSFSQLREYYQTQGRDWERYALIKARVITGVEKHKRQLASIIRQFVYRQYVDFSMMESLRILQQRISEEVRKKDLHNNVKRGPGGIREIEFIGQTYKLIRGGWQTRLQLGDTVRTMLLLREMRYLSAELADGLIAAYKFLRNLENFLQMQNDQQTHELPDEKFLRQRLLFALNIETWELLEQEVETHMSFVHKIFEELIARPQMQFEDHKVQALIKPMQAIWFDKYKPEQAKDFLFSCQFVDNEKNLHLLKHLRQSKVCQNLSSEMRKRLDEVVPYILVLVSQEKNPDEIVSRIIDVLEAILNHPIYLALLAENPPAMGQLVRLCAASPWIAEQIARFPALLDELLRPETLYAPPGLADLNKALDQQLISIPEDNVEEQIHTLQVFKQVHMLRVAAADITGVLSLMKVSDYLTYLATVVVNKVLAIVWHNMLLRYGSPTSQHTELSFAIIAYGKLGGIELGYGSDLDLVFIHEDIADDAMTDGGEQITSEQFYTRVGQQILTLLGGQTSAGRLYEVDVRLRPSGDSGLLVPSMSAFEVYQLHSAWPWEHQALVRARPIAGSKLLEKQFETVRERVLMQSRNQVDLQAEVKQMRHRMRDAVKEQHPGQFDVKQGVGGIADIEFLVQYAVLQWSHQDSELVTWTDNIRILENMGVAGLIHVDEARDLQNAYRAFRDAVHRLSLQNQPAWVSETDFAKERAIVTEIFQRLIG